MPKKLTETRLDGRNYDELRSVKIKTKVNRYAEGSCLIQMGNTQVLCLASVEDSLPDWRMEQGIGWVTGEYAMLPRATHTRSRRESVKGKVSGRTQEISRLVGRALRAVVDFKKLGPRSILVDCEVLQADGGTRCAAITGGYLALALACQSLKKQNKIKTFPLAGQVAAISVGIINGKLCLDLPYEEDSQAEVDMNVVMTDAGKIVELQGTAEGNPFTPLQAQKMITLAKSGIMELIQQQRKILKLT